jgi:predicted dehydrogenase
MISRFHARAVRELPGAKLVGCYDCVASVSRQFAKEFDVIRFQELDELLEHELVDVVTIATPSGAHMEPAVAAARRGKHVVVEKPLEITLGRCDKIIRECNKSGVLLSTLFPSRFHQCWQLLKQAIERGRFGTLTLGDAYVKWFRTQEYYDSGQWRGTWNLDGGGALMNQAIHTVDLLTWLMGPIVEVASHAATLAHERIDVEDVVTATLRFKSGALGVIEATTAAFPGMLKKIDIHGDRGSVSIEEDSIRIWQFAQMTSRDRQIESQLARQAPSGGGAADPASISHVGHARQFADVIYSIKSKTTPRIDGNEGRRSVEIILAIYKSAETGRAIRLPLARDPKLAGRQARSKKK